MSNDLDHDLGALLGLSPLTAHITIEGATGIRDGERTRLSGLMI